MARQSIVICGLARDCADSLPAMLQQLERLGDMFGSYEVIVVENDSSDQTGSLLDAWASHNSRVSAIRFSVVNFARLLTVEKMDGPDWFQADRIQRISFARNLYLAALAATEPDYVMIVDLDLLAIDLDGLATSFASPDIWKVVASNGLRYTLRTPLKPRVYWDTYAYEPPEGFANGVQTLAGIRRAQTALEQQLRTEGWHAAPSAFGGLCIYRAELLAGIEYSVLPNNDPSVPWLCEHIGLHRAMRKRDPAFSVHINPAQTVTYESLRRTITRSLAGALTRR